MKKLLQSRNKIGIIRYILLIVKGLLTLPNLTVSSDAYIHHTIGMIMFFGGSALKERVLSLMRAPRLPPTG
jgi:hypothetical protein